MITAAPSSRRAAASARACRIVHVSGGVSNFSFSFRGNETVREAMHSVFLYHAIKAGMDMGIVNAGQLAVYEDIPAELRDGIEDVLFNRREDATERLLDLAQRYKTTAAMPARRRRSPGARPVNERLKYALVHGIADFVERRHRRSAPGRRAPARRDRRPADGRHECGRRSVRRGQDVPAAGGQIRPRDEEGGGPSLPLHGSRAGSQQDQGTGRQHRHGDGEGRRARHRQEHRRRGASVQRLRGDRPRRDDAGAEDPRRRAKGKGQHHRPVRPDHAVAGRDGATSPPKWSGRASTFRC